MLDKMANVFFFFHLESTVWSTDNWWERTGGSAAFHMQLYVFGLFSLAKSLFSVPCWSFYQHLTEMSELLKNSTADGDCWYFKFKLFQTADEANNLRNI